MAIITPKEFAIDSTMEYASDGYRFTKPGSSLIRTADTDDRVTLRMGLLDINDVPQMITAMSDAVIDEYECAIHGSSIIETIRGRDAGAAILDHTYKQWFRRTPIAEIVAEVPPPDGTPVIPQQVGRFWASQIAAAACASVGLGLSWGCPDYQFFVDFTASGSVISILRTLSAPWNLLDPFKVDIYIQASTVVVASRAYPLNRIDYASTLKDAKRSEFIVRKRPTRGYGLVTLRGQKVANADANNQGPQPTRRSFTASYPTDPGSGATSRVAYNVRYRMPDNVLEYEQKTSYGLDASGNMTLVLRETTNKDWTSVRYDGQGRPLKPALEIRSLTVIERVDPSDEQQVLRAWETDDTSYGYDADGYVNVTTTIKQVLDLDSGNMVNSEMVIKDIVPTAPLLNDAVTTNFKWEEDINEVLTWVFQRRDVAPVGGHKPGGPGRGQPTGGGVPRPGPPSPIQGGSAQIVLSQDFGNGLDFSYSNENLTMANLQTIMSMFAATDGIWEYEVETGGVGQPWLQRGTTVQFTEILLEDGVTELPLPVLLITEVRTHYDESKTEAAMLYKCRAFGYAGA